MELVVAQEGGNQGQSAEGDSADEGEGMAAESQAECLEEQAD